MQNDHKPLETYLRKPLSSAFKRLQDIMMKLHRYDTEFKYLTGEELVIADTLGKTYANVTDLAELFSVKIKDDLQDSRLKEIKDATDQDPDLQELTDTI